MMQYVRYGRFLIKGYQRHLDFYLPIWVARGYNCTVLI